MSRRIARMIALAIGTAGLMQAPPPAAAQSAPETENGRYSLAPLADGGFVRLDTRSGTVSKCVNAPSGWDCWMLPDERAAMDAEIGRLQAENESLRGRLSSVEAEKSPSKSADALPKTDPLAPSMPRTPDGERKLEIPLPSDRDVDRFMAVIERAWRRLIEMAGRLQRDSSGKI